MTHLTDPCGRCLLQLCTSCNNMDLFADNSCDAEMVFDDFQNKKVETMSIEEIESSINSINIHEAYCEF